MISEQEAIENLNNASVDDIGIMNGHLNENVLVAPLEPVGGAGISDSQRDETTEFLNSLAWESGLTINDHLNGVALAGKHPCD